MHVMRNIASALAVAAALIGGAAIQAGAEPAKAPSYKVIVEGYDWGPSVSRLVLDAGQDVAASSLSADDFSVYVERKVPATGALVQVYDFATKTLSDSKGERKVVDVYLSDASGAKSSAASGRYVAIAMKVGPDISLASPFNFDFKSFLNSYIKVEHTIAQKGAIKGPSGAAVQGLGCGPAAESGSVSLVADNFDTKGVIDYADPLYGAITLHYASYAPAANGKKRPLVIWLHGAGEGGTDPYVAILGNRVTQLALDPVQKIFGGAYVLVPQSPIVWMNNGQKSYPEDGTTQYSGAVKNLIDSFIASHADIDAKRVYIGGCSNGGYMTMNMLLRYPGFFAAAYPVCEAYLDKWISEYQISMIKDTPIWFTQAATDKTVAPSASTIPTYKRLIAAGAKNVHFSYWPKVEDLSGLYKKADGSAYEYDGHWSWVYTLDNACARDFDGGPVLVNGKAVSIMEWLAAQTK